MEIQDLLQWLESTDLRLTSSKTMWGMPDSASERLSAHLVKSNAAFELTALTLTMSSFNCYYKSVFFFFLAIGVVQ